MKLLFSETAPDYTHYLYPYVVWGFLEPGETPADAFAAGFLPGLPTLDRFYLVRQVRVPLVGWKPNSENRRILRKGAGFECSVIPKPLFDYSASRRDRWLAYAAERFGEGVMPVERLDGLMHGAVISHLLHFTETATGRELGTVLMLLEPPRMAYYYFAFYDLAFTDRNLGMYMMTQAVGFFAAQGYGHIYLGTCVTKKALYKTQFDRLEFFNGNRWSDNLAELKHLVETSCPGRHRLDTPEFMALQPGSAAEMAAASRVRVTSDE